MNPFKIITRPIADLTQAVVMPLKALFVVGLCAAINAMTAPGHWWFKWVALGMGIAVLVSWARALRTLLTLALVGGVGWWLYRRHGQAAREHYDAWVQRAQPAAAQVLAALRGAPAAGGV